MAFYCIETGANRKTEGFAERRKVIGEKSNGKVNQGGFPY